MCRKTIWLCLLAIVMGACGGSKKQTNTLQTQVRQVPAFSADSAYEYVATQVNFGPRVPNTKAHEECARYLAASLERLGAKVVCQNTDLEAFDGTILHATNIIGSFAPEKQRRILLCAHWDTRPFSDAETDSTLWHTPIDGANDGASGIGVLLELARHIPNMSLNVGVDIVFFDAEDYGTPEFYRGSTSEHTWCLGAQHWAKHPHVPNYKAEYGILLDMVGAPDALFTYEYFSYQYGAHLLEKVWNTAHQLGYHRWFTTTKTYPITDDHYYVNTIAKIPCIDIIHHNPYTSHGFGAFWHTQDDTMKNISPTTLHAVGNTLLHVLANE